MVRVVVLTLLVAVPVLVFAQRTDDFVIGETVQFESRVLDETQTLIIGKPQGYDGGELRYPVLYLLDGSANFHHTTGITSFLASSQRIPGLLVVAINNNDRNRDLTTPSLDPEYPFSHGGADRFLRYLREELVPWVDEQYRTRPYRILVGHSLGGFFVVHSLFSEPRAFDAYVAISPSLQYDNQQAVRNAEAVLRSGGQFDGTLYMAVGSEGDTLLSGMRRLAALLDEGAPERFRWTFERMPSESHSSVVHRATYQALEFIFGDWHLPNALAMYERFGIEAIDRFYERSGDKYGIERQTPELILMMDLLVPLLEANRLRELAKILLRDPEKYPPSENLSEFLAAEYSDGSFDPEDVAAFVELVRTSLDEETANDILRVLESESD